MPADPIALARDLIRCPSVTPAEGGALALIERVLKGAGFDGPARDVRGARHRPDRESLRAHRHRGAASHVAGHTDVVPPGDEAKWSHPPFAAEIADGVLYGRGAVDMKGAIACKIAAALDYLAAHGGKPKGSISFLITGDEEGIAVNGTIKLLEWLAERGEKFDHCHSGRADQSADARRHDQDRPARLAERHADRHRHAGARRLSGTRRQSGARHRRADRRDQRRAARQRHRAFRAVEPGVHLDRCRQQDRQPDSRARRARASTSASTISARARNCATEIERRAAQGGGQRHPLAHRMGAVERRCVPHRARAVRRDGQQGDHRGDRARRRSSRPPAARRTRASSRIIAR